MLVLTRRAGQRLFIGDEIVVTVLEVNGERVKVGVEAPNTFRVLRDELLQQLAQENRQAAIDRSQIKILLGGLGPPATPA
jgi:carbon storage regulator